jgi:hypothetical protein
LTKFDCIIAKAITTGGVFMFHRLLLLAVVFVSVFATVPSFADGPKKIQDNSFLLEEAYNQEDGVIQHISLFQYLKKSKDWQYIFTQE